MFAWAGSHDLDVCQALCKQLCASPLIVRQPPWSLSFQCCVTLKFHTFMTHKELKSCRSQVLFFSRLLADVCGRTVPRVKVLAVHSRVTLFALGCCMTASIPGYLYYIKASPWHSDWAITGADPYDPSTCNDHLLRLLLVVVPQITGLSHQVMEIAGPQSHQCGGVR